MRRALPYLLVCATLTIWAVLPQVLSRHYVDLLVFAAIYSIAGLGVSFLIGQCGIVNLCQALFYGIGAYSSAYLTAKIGAPIIVGFGVGIFITLMIAVAIGWPMLRLTGYFLALGTLALGIIGSALFHEWDWITGGVLGTGSIPFISLFGYELNTPVRFYFFVWPLTFLCLVLGHHLLTSRTGLMLRAMRDSDTAAISLAIDLQWLRTRVFMLSAVMGCIAGSLFAHYTAFVSVQSFTVEKSFSFLLVAVLGGASSILGPVVGSLVITFMPDFLSSFGDIYQILFGLILIAFVLALPDGLVSLPVSLWRAFSTRGATK